MNGILVNKILINRILIKFIAVLIGLLIFTQVQAFGKTGHRVIGQIAQNHLTPQTILQIKKILGDDSLAEVSNWADFMRSDPHPFWNKYSSWHYVNIPAGKNYNNSKKISTGNIYQAINAFVNILKNKPLEDNPIKEGLAFYFGDLNASKNKAKLQVFALKFLVHLIGDLHQPLHTGHYKDYGGNKIKVKWFGQNTNLHSVWDSKIIDSSQLSYTELVAFLDSSDKKQIAVIQDTKIIDWLNESLKLREIAYDAGNKDLKYQYYYKHYPLLQQQMLKGGFRLANTLNDIFVK